MPVVAAWPASAVAVVVVVGADWHRAGAVGRGCCGQASIG